jgi:hypothetical protein
VGNIFNSRGPFHESIIKEQRKASRGEQSKCAACNALQRNKHTGSSCVLQLF